MGFKLFVGNLPYSFTSDDLKTTFEPFGAVASAKVVMDRETGRSRGFGFVEMSNDSEASAAMEGLNGHQLNGRALTANEARPREEGGSSGGGRGGYGGGAGGRGGFGGGRSSGGGYGGGRY